MELHTIGINVGKWEQIAAGEMPLSELEGTINCQRAADYCCEIRRRAESQSQS
jgi:hypothetical protein